MTIIEINAKRERRKGVGRERERERERERIMESSREARRRRILERGSDRLALITGRIQTLPSSSSSASSSPRDHDLPSRTPAAPQSDNGVPTMSKSNSSIETGQQNAYYGGSGVEPRLCKPETSKEALKFPALELNETSRTPALGDNETSKTPALGLNATSRTPALRFNETSKAPTLETSRIKELHVGSSTVQKPSVSTANPYTHQHRLFTASQISSAISASESTRILCSMAAALLVVLSNSGFPGLGNRIVKSITATRPLYLLLLTNLTVVIARLLSDKQGGSTSAGKVVNKAPLESSNDWTDQAGKALEAFLLLQKVVDSVFMDFSFYAIIVVCGLSLANLFSS